MNSITPAYSVFAFLLVAGCTLIGFPTSVFSQSDTASNATTPVHSAITEQAPIAANQTDDSIAPHTKSQDSAYDSYKRDKLPGDDVFHDFVVGPGKFDLQLAPGQSKTVEMTISNRMGERKKFSISFEDVTGSSDSSKAVVLLGNQRGPYTLKDLISVPHTQFYLNQGERARVPVTVTLPKDAEPGGRYGSLLVSIVSDKIDNSDANGAKPGSVVVSRIGTLFFVTTPGSLDLKGDLKHFSTIGEQKIFSKGPISFSILMENTGTVHMTPYGEVHIYNMLGDEVGSSQLDPWYVLPQSLRSREFSWDRGFMMGRYTAVAQINRGYDNKVDEKSFTFWVIPWKLLALVFVGIFLFFLLLRLIFSRFEFKRKSK